MPLAAWETEDGDVIVWGTHDPEVATLIIEEAIRAGMVIMDPFGEGDDDKQYQEEFWLWVRSGPRILRWAHNSLIDEEVWPTWLLVDTEREHTVPVMKIAR